MIITFNQPRKVILGEAESRVGYELARLDKGDNRSSSNLLNVLSAELSKESFVQKDFP